MRQVIVDGLVRMRRKRRVRHLEIRGSGLTLCLLPLRFQSWLVASLRSDLSNSAPQYATACPVSKFNFPDVMEG